jgi:protein-S-isoprenylcysteine O-methyltransferase Ste14
MLLGTALLSGVGSWVVYMLVATALLAAKILAEERLLSATFGAEYRAYQRRVPRLIPGARLLHAQWSHGGEERTRT